MENRIEIENFFTWKLDPLRLAGARRELLLGRELQAEHGHELVGDGDRDVETVGEGQQLADHLQARLDAAVVDDVQERGHHLVVSVGQVQDGVVLLPSHVQHLTREC